MTQYFLNSHKLISKSRIVSLPGLGIDVFDRCTDRIKVMDYSIVRVYPLHRLYLSSGAGHSGVPPCLGCCAQCFSDPNSTVPLWTRVFEFFRSTSKTEIDYEVKGVNYMVMKETRLWVVSAQINAHRMYYRIAYPRHTHTRITHTHIKCYQPMLPQYISL